MGAAPAVADSDARALAAHPHRADIEGLRGVAVLAVLAVHAWPELLRGGFVGVDIFFVLSGFLIASAQFREWADGGRFDPIGFYERRVRRLLPALVVVLACCGVAALFTFPSEARQIGRHLAAGALFVSNLALWQEAGYFDAASESKPLLHLWSLGIEEQFYLLWPLLAVFAIRWPRLALRGVLALALVSFTLNVMLVESRAKGTFFLLPTRAWELLAGVALARAIFKSGRAGPLAGRRFGPWPASDAAAWSGAALIAAAFALLDREPLPPGWWALLPTLGTVLLLAAGPSAWLNSRVLAHPVLRFYGAISYSLYLWHWPLLVFPQLLGAPLDIGTRVLVVVASVALAALTTEYVERPVRFGALERDRRVPVALLAALAMIGAAGVGLHRSDGRIEAYPREVQALARAEFGFDFRAYRAGRCFLDLQQGPEAFAPECDAADERDASDRGSVLLWGDSHAASLYPGLAAGPSGSLRQMTKARCPPLVEPPPGASLQCATVIARVLEGIEARPPHTVLLGAHWLFYSAAGGGSIDLSALLSTVSRLQRAGVQRVVVIGPLPVWTDRLPRLLLHQWRREGRVPERLRDAIDPRAPRVDAALREALAGSGAHFVSPLQLLCEPDLGCLASRLHEDVPVPLAHDDSHLNGHGSRLLVTRAAGELGGRGD